MTCCDWRANKPQLSVPQLPFSQSAFLCSVSWTIMTPTGLNRYEPVALLRQNAQCGSGPSTHTHTNTDVIRKLHKWSQTCRLLKSKTLDLSLWCSKYLSSSFPIYFRVQLILFSLKPYSQFPLSRGLGTLGRASPAGCVGRVQSLIHPQRALWLNRLAQGHGAEWREEHRRYGATRSHSHIQLEQSYWRQGKCELSRVRRRHLGVGFGFCKRGRKWSSGRDCVGSHVSGGAH